MNPKEQAIDSLVELSMELSEGGVGRASVNPFTCVDTGVPEFFKRMHAAIGRTCRLVVKVAGGAETVGNEKGYFETGKRNYNMLKKILWKRGVLIDAQDIGGNQPRTMHLEIGSGRVWLNCGGRKRDL